MLTAACHLVVISSIVSVKTIRLLRKDSCCAETRREGKKKIMHVSWETLYCLYIVNMHGTQNIKTLYMEIILI